LKFPTSGQLPSKLTKKMYTLHVKVKLPNLPSAPKTASHNVQS